MSIFNVLREVAELVRRDRAVPLAVIQQQFALSDHDLATIVDELTGPRGEATVDDGVLRAGTAAAESVESLPRGETEQRDLTVLFCDLVGSTALSTRLDAEDFSEAIRAYYDQVTAVVGRYGGHVANLMGDGLLVLFGYPQAHDDTARQAVAAALAALAAVGAHGSDFEIRIGLHVGPVVVSNIGPGGRAGALALGETVNVAARVQSAAEPGSAYISDDLARLVDGWFQIEPVGERLFKGLRVPMMVSRVVGSTGARNAIEARLGRGLRLVTGRDAELATINDAWADARRGDGRLVALIGEPGIGKSRLIEEVRREVADDAEWLAGGCSPYSTATALHPFAEMIDLGSLMVAAPPDGLSAEGRRKWVLNAMNERIVGSAGRPVVLAVEDLHWADPTSLELLDLVRDNIDDASVLVLLTSREPLPAHWSGQHVVSLALEPLDGNVCADLIANLMGDRALTADVVAQIVERAGGNPLYLEELTNMHVEGDGAVHGEEIPPALQSPLLARLDGLGDAKPIAQVASVFGAQFTAAALVAVLDSEHRDRLPAALERMVEKGLILANGRQLDRYTFRHALIHDAAYQSLLKRRRREIHGRVLDLWREQSEANGDPAVEVVARHAVAAERHSEAADLFALAGRQAAARSAYAEAVQHYHGALAALAELGDDQRRRQLAVLRSLASALIASRGYTHPETAATWQRTHDLAIALDDRVEITASLLGLAIVRYGSADLAGASALIDEAANGAEATGNDEQLVVAFAERTMVAYFGGRFLAALENGDAGFALYDAGRHHQRIVELVGDDSGVAAVSTSAWALMQLGRPDDAIARGRAAVAIARSNGHLFSLAQAWLWMMLLLNDLGEGDLAETQELIAFCDEQDFRLWGGAARVVAAAIIGDPLLHYAGRDLAASTSSIAMLPAICVIEADTLRRVGDLRAAWQAVDDGIGFADAVNVPFADVPLLRHRAELLAAGAGPEPGTPAEVEELLHRALAVADVQGTHWYALRAAARLAEHLAQQGRADDARAVLAPRLAVIVGGENLTIVKAARTLLDELTENRTQ